MAKQEKHKIPEDRFFYYDDMADLVLSMRDGKKLPLIDRTEVCVELTQQEIDEGWE